MLVIVGNAFCFLSSFPWSVLFFGLSFVPSFSNLSCAPWLVLFLELY